MTHDCLSIYFAGGLFDQKALAGNEMLALAVEQVSSGRYHCVLPQNLEQSSHRVVNIRNQDLSRVMTCDLAIFNFDGSDLDSGTVVEFIFAKLLDIPCVIVRGDFRKGGDGLKDGDPWNLMCSGYPRTRALSFNSMQWYQEAMRSTTSPEMGLKRFHDRVAAAIVDNLDAVRTEEPVGHGEHVNVVYEWATQFPGAGFSKLVSEEKAAALIEEKRSKGLL